MIKSRVAKTLVLFLFSLKCLVKGFQNGNLVGLSGYIKLSHNPDPTQI